MDRIEQLSKSGANVETMVEEVTRRNIFRREFERAVTDGQGDLSPDYILKQLPQTLALESKTVSLAVSSH